MRLLTVILGILLLAASVLDTFDEAARRKNCRKGKK